MLPCAEAPGLVPMAGGVPIAVPLGLESLGEADTVVVPGRATAGAPVPEAVVAARRVRRGRRRWSAAASSAGT